MAGNDEDNRSFSDFTRGIFTLGKETGTPKLKLYLMQGDDMTGATGGGNIGERVSALEAKVDHLQGDVSDVKTDIREIRSDLWIKFLITWGGLIAGVLGLAWMMAKGFEWI